MKRFIRQIYLVFLFLGVLLTLAYFIPYAWGISSNVSYQFVIFFLLLILGSNLLAKIAYVYVNS